MLLMGDEIGRSQGGNNNTWCQNTPLGWMIWKEDNCDNELRLFVKQLIKIRKNLLHIFSPENTPISKTSFHEQSKQLLVCCLNK